MRLSYWLFQMLVRTVTLPKAGPGASGSHRKRESRLGGIECLEARTLLTTEISLSGFTLVIFDGAEGGQSDTLTITSDANNSKYVISDPNQILVATGIPGAVVSGDQHSVDVPFASVPGSEILVNTFGGADSITVDSVDGTFQAGLTIYGGMGTDTVTLNSSLAFAVGKSLVVHAESFNTAATANVVTSGEGAITVYADDVALNLTSTLVSPNTITISPQATGRNISLGAETAGELSLTDAEVDRITAGTLVFGDEQTGGLLVHGTGLSPAGTSTLSLNSGGSTNGSGIVVQNLAMTAGVGIIYSGDVQNIAARTTNGTIWLTDANGLTVTSVAGVDGVVTQLESGQGNVMINVTSGNLSVLNTPAEADIRGQGITITLDGNGAIFSTATGSVIHNIGGALYTITADEMTLQGTLQSDHSLRMQPFSPGVQMILGTNPASANTLELSVAELDLIDAPSSLFIGRNDASAAGDITITSSIIFTSDMVRLETSGGIIDANVTGFDLVAPAIYLRTATGIGASGADQTIETSTSELGVENLISGDILVQNVGNLVLNSGNVPALKNDGGSISITNTGNILALAPVTVAGDGNITLDAQGVSSDIIIQSNLTSAAGQITLRADDNITGTSSTGGVQTTSGNLFFYPDDDASGTGTLTINRPINLGSGTALFDVLNPGGSIDGVISGSGNLSKTGAGTLTVSAANTYTGTTSINAGQLTINGSIDSNTTVASGAILAGSGVINSANTLAVQSGGRVTPGTSPGILKSGNTTFQSGSTLSVELNGTVADSEYDQLEVTGTVSLASPLLEISLGYIPSPGDTFTILKNDGDDAISGTFNGLAEGAIFEVDGYSFQISYLGGTGNDVVLTSTVANSNEAPTDIGLVPTTLDEMQPIGTAVGTLTTTDPDADDTFMYTLVSGEGSTDNSQFQIDDNVLRTNAVLSFDTQQSYSIRVRSSDAGELTTEKVFTIQLTPVDVSLLDLSGPAVTWIKRQPPVTVMPQVEVASGFSFAGGTLTLSIATIGTRRKALDQVVIPPVLFGSSNSVSRSPLLTTVTIQLGANDTAAQIQAFLRDIRFSTKGKGLRTPTRVMQVTLTDNDGHSTQVTQTIHVRKKA